MLRRRFNCCLRAFTLVEALVTLALIGIVLLVFGQLVATMSRHSRSLDSKDELTAGTLTALERMRRDVRMGVAWNTPAVSDTGLQTTLEFDIPDYENQAVRLPPYTPGTLATPAWNPLAAGSLIHVRYRVDQTRLLREVLVSGAFEATPLAYGVAGLSVRRTARAEMTVTLSVGQVPEPVQALVDVVGLPLKQSWRQP